MGEEQHVVGAVAQDFEQGAGLVLAGAGASAGGSGEPRRYPVAEPAEQRVAGAISPNIWLHMIYRVGRKGPREGCSRLTPFRAGHDEPPTWCQGWGGGWVCRVVCTRWVSGVLTATLREKNRVSVR